MTLSRWLNLWINIKKTRIKMKTYCSYKYIIDQYIVPYLGEIKIIRCNSFFLNKYIDGFLIKKDLSRSTLNMIITVIKVAIKDYYFEILKKDSPNIKISLPNKFIKRKESFSLLEQQKIEKHILGKKNYNLYGILISLHTGVRLGELLSLEWSDIDFKESKININKTLYEGKDYEGKHVIKVNSPKSDSSKRIIIVSRNILKMLKEMKSNAKTKFVIESRNKRQSLRSYQNKFTRLLKKLNIEYKNFHCLRHTFASRSIESKMDIKVVSETLGHSSIKITIDRYVKLFDDYKKKEIEKLDKYLIKKCSFNNLLDVSST